MGKSYYSLIFSIYGIALVLCSASRIFLRLFWIDEETGFYKADRPMILLFNLTLAAAVVLMLLLNRLRRTDNDYPIFREGRGIGVLSILVGLSILAFTLEDTGWVRFSSRSVASLADKTIQFSSQGTPYHFQMWFAGILGIVSVLAFLLIGLRIIKFGRSKAAYGVFTLFPALWQVSLLIMKFNDYTTLTTISDNLLVVLFMASTSMYLIGHARTICGFSRKDGRNYMIPLGLTTSLLGFLLVVPNYLYMFLERTGQPSPMIGEMESIYILLMSIYAWASVLRLRRSIVLV